MKVFQTIAMLLLVLLPVTGPAAAQPLPAPEPTIAEIEDLRARVRLAESIPEEDRTTLKEQLNAAQGNLEKAAEFRAAAARRRTEMQQADARAAEFEQRLQDAQDNPPDPADALDPDATLETLEGEFTLATAERQSLIERRRQLIDAVERQPQRRNQIRDRLVALQATISEAPPAEPPKSPTLMEEVARMQALTRTQAALAEKEALEAEIITEPARSAVSTAERAWLGYAIGAAEERLDAIDAALDEARAKATRRQLETTSRLEDRLQLDDPRIQQFAEENRRLATQLQLVSGEIEEARREGQSIRLQLQGIEQDQQLMERRLEAAGRKELLGRVMITRLASLPDTDALRRGVSRRNSLIADTSLAQIDTEEDFRSLNESRKKEGNLHRELQALDEESRETIGKLVDQRIELLENNLTSLGALLRLLLDNNDNARELMQAADQFDRFLLGNLLWVRNFSFLDPAMLLEQIAALTSPANWKAVPAQTVSGYRNLSWSSLLLVALGLSFLLRWRLKPAYNSLISQPLLLSSTTLLNLVGGLVLTALLVAPWPLTMYILGHFLGAADAETAFSAALAPALTYTALVLFLLLFTRLIANRKGVGRRFLKWNTRMLDLLRAELNWAGPLLCVSLLLNLFAFHLELVSSGGPLSALSIAVCALTLITFSLRLLQNEIYREAGIIRLGLWVCAGIAGVVLLMQFTGLVFAAEMYLVSLARTIVVLLLIKLASDTLERWLLILRARMGRKERERLRDLDAEDGDSIEKEEQQLDLLSLSEAHRKLLGIVRAVATAIALWAIWSPSLPALNLLESVTLWSVSDSANPGTLREITLFDLFYSLVILVVTGLITRHLPSLSEVFMREWFSMSAGARYASSILLQYLVIAIGASLFLSTIGWEWSKLQWLVAALGVGIGFGLQEIVANFISGIIILFERPVRVGDIITAGGAEGVVKKINPRATIIETFDRKEHLIPNKELITGQVINWTLSDGAVRVIIPVGIAYGSDVRRALALLIESAKEVANVLDDPEPRASFEDFGDNALVLWLRCFVTEDRVGTWTDLRTIINEKFAQAGIVIAFPQRDIHLDVPEPLQLEVRHLGELKPA